jgi:hypothetical protein
MTFAISSAHAQENEEVTVVLSADEVSTISSAIASATTPEEAARLFAKLASQAIGQAVADSLTRVIDRAAAQTADDQAIIGWQELVVEGGLAMELHWPSPGLLPAGNLPVYSTLGRPAEGATPAAVGVSITITG